MGNKTNVHKPRSIRPCQQQPSGSVESMEEEAEKVDNLSYFYSELSRTQAEDVMRRYANKPGSFLLRLGSKYRRYAVTLVLDQNVIGHIEINSPNDETFYAESEIEFSNMSDLIKHYRDHPIPINTPNPILVKLKHPVHRFRQQQPFPYQSDCIKYETCTSTSPTYDEVVQHGAATERPKRSLFWDGGELVELRAPPPQPPCGDRLLSTSDEETTPKKIYAKNSDKNSPNCYTGTQEKAYVEPETFPVPLTANPQTLSSCTKGTYIDPNDANTMPKVFFASHSQNTKQRRRSTDLPCDHRGYLEPRSETSKKNCKKVKNYKKKKQDSKKNIK